MLTSDVCVYRGERPIEQLEVALDALYNRKLPFFGRYHLFSAVERRTGGQGLVQFARIGNTTDTVRALLIVSSGSPVLAIP